MGGMVITPSHPRSSSQQLASHARCQGSLSRCRSKQNLKRSYNRNQQYSITAITDGSGAIVERYAYSAYGIPTITDASGTTRTTTAIGNRYTYTGREFDETLALYHYRARMYDPVGGRFVSRDPIGYEDGENLHQFVRSQPSRRIDHEGTDSYWVGGSSPGDHSKICVDKPCGGYYCCEVGGPDDGGSSSGGSSGTGTGGNSGNASCSSGNGNGGVIDFCTEIGACLGVWVKPKKINCQTVSSLTFAGNVTATYPQTPQQDQDMYEDLFNDHGTTWWWNGVFSSCHVYVKTR
jgi:RHS repeat-associated protein